MGGADAGGLDPDHPRAAYLKMKGLTASPGAIPRGLVHVPGFAKWVGDRGVAMAPLVTWLAKTVK